MLNLDFVGMAVSAHKMRVVNTYYRHSLDSLEEKTTTTIKELSEWSGSTTGPSEKVLTDYCQIFHMSLYSILAHIIREKLGDYFTLFDKTSVGDPSWVVYDQLSGPQRLLAFPLVNELHAETVETANAAETWGRTIANSLHGDRPGKFGEWAVDMGSAIQSRMVSTAYLGLPDTVLNRIGYSAIISAMYLSISRAFRAKAYDTISAALRAFETTSRVLAKVNPEVRGPAISWDYINYKLHMFLAYLAAQTSRWDKLEGYLLRLKQIDVPVLYELEPFESFLLSCFYAEGWIKAAATLERLWLMEFPVIIEVDYYRSRLYPTQYLDFTDPGSTRVLIDASMWSTAILGRLFTVERPAELPQEDAFFEQFTSVHPVAEARNLRNEDRSTPNSISAEIDDHGAAIQTPRQESPILNQPISGEFNHSPSRMDNAYSEDFNDVSTGSEYDGIGSDRDSQTDEFGFGWDRAGDSLGVFDGVPTIPANSSVGLSDGAA
ncbi:hypothetical protein H4R33_001292 [Dimargaris cristalligena]|nr:hypothetical protein H4R33_001292 [Dimargaris cristalligena]